jgi:hypothetical protein
MLGLALSVGMAAGRAFAQDHPSQPDLVHARELFNEGMDRREAGDAASAVEKLTAAHNLAQTPITGLELGRTYMMLGKLVEARQVLLSVSAIARWSAETAKSAAARAESAKLAEQLRTRIPTLRVTIAGAPTDSVAVTIDGAGLSMDALTGPYPLDPGSHHLVARASGGQTGEAHVDLKEGDAKDVQLELGAPHQEHPATAAGASPTRDSHAPQGASAPLDHAARAVPAAEGSHSNMRTIAAIVGGSGLALAAVGGVLTIIAKVNDDAAANETLTARQTDSASATQLGNVATGFAIAGGVVAITGAVLWFTAPSAPTQVGCNGRELLIRGTF